MNIIKTRRQPNMYYLDYEITIYILKTVNDPNQKLYCIKSIGI